VRDAADRRRVLVEATDRVEQATRQLYGPLASAGDKLLARYTDDELRAMIDVMRESARLQLEQAERVRSQAQKS
jgi:DNA-binding MarR family transcriptional regulator